MQQFYAPNTEYEIWTPNGWEEFQGVIFNENANKPSLNIEFSDGLFITATEEHRFFKNGVEIAAHELIVGDIVDATPSPKCIKNIKKVTLNNTFDVYNAKNHVIICNGVFSHQCDELAFVRSNISKQFFTSIIPTLSTGGKAIITSTPNGDEDQFAQIWKEANQCIDEYGNPTEVGKNGFKAYRAHWYEHPERDEKFKESMIAQLGELAWQVEYACLSDNNVITIQSETGEIFDITIGELYNTIDQITPT